MDRSGFLLLFVCFTAGCGHRAVTVRSQATTAASVADLPAYTLGCPDLLEVHFAGHPDWDALASVDVDGCLPLGSAGRPRVEGLKLHDARAGIAREARLDADRVSVSLVDPSAEFLNVHGPEANRQQMLVYRVPERVVGLLRRIGALKPGCTDPRDISVLRPNVACGRPSELFRVDFDDEATDVALRPGDQIYIGETRRSSFCRLLPNWMKPLYKRLFRVWI